VLLGRLDNLEARVAVRVALATAAVLLCYVLATPRSGGPDEPSHMIASAALVRGERAGSVFEPSAGITRYRVPAMVGAPNPGCWALQPYTPASCASLESGSTADVLATTTSANYPPWSYLVPGLASFVPSAGMYAYLARALMAAVPWLLVSAALIHVRAVGRAPALAALLGLTPIAWFSMSIVNPSAVAIAGGLALWAALLTPPGRRGDILMVAGWAATMLPRRDGPVWATLIVVAACGATGLGPRKLLAQRPRWVTWSMVSVSVVAVATAVLIGQRGSELLLAAAPAALVALEWVVVRWQAATSRNARAALAGLSAAAVSGVIAVALMARPGGFDAGLLRLVMSTTGEHLRQLVGVLGWLDTPVPTFAVYLFWAAVGALAAAAYVECRRAAIVGAASFVAVVVTAWLLELGQGSVSGTYWQGRYSVPLVVGLPLLLATRPRRSLRGPAPSSGLVTGFSGPLAGVVWVIGVAGFAAALQRWGVGLAGSWWPWDWDTWGAPLPPWMLLLAYGAASAWLIATCARPVGPERAEVP
jgi:hypothetical protein